LPGSRLFYWSVTKLRIVNLDKSRCESNVFYAGAFIKIPFKNGALPCQPKKRNNRRKTVRFLPDHAELTDKRGYPRWHGRETPKAGLYFLGFRNPPTGMLREINLEARRIAQDIKRKHPHMHYVI